MSEQMGDLYDGYFTHGAAVDTSRRSRDGRLAALLLYARFGYANAGLHPWERVVGGLLALLRPLTDEVGRHIMWLGACDRGELLDVGCGSGQMLVFARRLGWRVSGMEPDEAAALHARERGLHVVNGSLQDLVRQTDRYDAITMNHVIEHLADPVESMRHCKHLLKPGGRLVIATPNVDSLAHRIFKDAWRGLEVPRHFCLFSPPSLRSALSLAGFSRLSVRTVSRSARWMWAASSQSRRAGSLSGGTPVDVGLWDRVQGLGLQLVEEFASPVLDVGEEVLAVAEKRIL